MPAFPDPLPRAAEEAIEKLIPAVLTAERSISELGAGIVKRINVPYNSSSPPGLVEANTRDPFNKSGKYALGWVYFCIILLFFASVVRFYNAFTDRIRTALHQEEVLQSSITSSPDTDYELSVLDTDKSTNKFFPRSGELPAPPKTGPSVSTFRPLNYTIALFRWVFYRPLPVIPTKKGWAPIVFPSLSVTIIVFAALVFVTLYCFVPQPLYWDSIAYGSPPLAIRAGMIAVSMVPWIIALSMKANIISLLTGIGHERLNVLHRWGGYLCLFLALVHMIPFYVTPIWDQAGAITFKSFLSQKGFYPYGTGVAAFAPLAFLCVHSVPQLRHRMYEFFVVLHVPVAIVFLAMIFWHCKNFLTSWDYLFTTLAIWLFSYLTRCFFLNWTNPFRLSWLIGDEAAVTILPENAIKVTIPTQVKWKPGQYVYLRMPGISVFENHPFTIASLCSDDFPSAYGEGYRDMVLVFRPYGGFTEKVLESAVEHGPWHTYRAFIDGPYGGMPRRIESFDHVILIAGGSGITAIVSQLLDLIKRMRDGKAVTMSVQVIWALKRPETMEWFREELRICREFAPPDTVQCRFYITTAKRIARTGQLVSAQTPTRPVSLYFHDRVNEAFQDIADKRLSSISTKRHSALIRDEAQGDPEREKELRRENEDAITALPQAHLRPSGPRNHSQPSSQEGLGIYQSALPTIQHPIPVHPGVPGAHVPISLRRGQGVRNLSVDINTAIASGAPAASTLDPSLTSPHPGQPPQPFDFGFPSTPTEFQKSLMRFAFLPATVRKPAATGWSTEYGRPDIPYLLKEMVREGKGRRTCVFVCGPPGMRVAVAETVARLQSEVFQNPEREEIFLHAENYAI